MMDSIPSLIMNSFINLIFIPPDTSQKVFFDSL